MGFFERDNARLHFQEIGEGEPIIALHGLAQHSDYWMKTGIADALGKTYRFIALDLRGHGQTTVEGEPKGYNIDTLVEDVRALADHLSIDRFHLMGHSTGGMVASRFAMNYASSKDNQAAEEDSRLLSLMMVNSSSSTQFSNLSETANAVAINMLATSFETFSWPMIIQGLKLNPGPLFAGIANANNRQALYAQALELMKGSDGRSVGGFIREFYDDANPYVERLAKIVCPTLIITAELDHIFTKTSRILAEHIPRHTVHHHPSCGHMTAIEDPQWVINTLLIFLDIDALHL